MAATAAPATDASTVVILLDVNPWTWHKLDEGRSSSATGDGTTLSLQECVEQVVAFVKALLMLNGANSVLLYGFSGDRCDVLYDSREPDQSEVRTVVISALLRTQKERSSEVSRGAPASSREGHLSSSALDSALTIALCRIQRLKREKICSNPRVLCIQASQDSPRQYVPTMNAIFAAQRAMVPIDVCVLGTAESSLLQQASFLSGGVYQNIAYPGGLLQYLISVFAIDLYTRPNLHMPQPGGVDFRASCFCHQKAVDVGFVCSVCLSIFCSRMAECSTCGAKFNPTDEPKKLNEAALLKEIHAAK